MEDTPTPASEVSSVPNNTPNSDVPVETKLETEVQSDIGANKDESGIVLDGATEQNVERKDSFTDPCEVNDDARSLDLDSLPAGDELVLGAAGSDSGVEGCGRALSSGGGSRSCASSVVSCGSGCSESSSLAGAPPRPRRRVNVTVTEPKRSSPIGTSTPRPTTAPRGPNLATRERARSREKPIPPEKPRPLTPKPRIRPTGDLPSVIRESPALRAKPTKTSTARCRTPNSPSDELKKWPMNGSRIISATDSNAARVTADKYGTLPRRRREGDSDGSPKHEVTPPSSRRPTVTRSISTRSATRTRVRIYAEKVSQTVLLGTDVESALAGIMPNIETHIEVTKCHRGVQASSRDAELTRLTAAAATAEAAAAEEKERRMHVEAQLAAERAARLSAIAELERNTQKLLELAGAGAGGDADGSLRALEDQLRAAGELATRQRGEIDTLRANCDKMHAEACVAREAARTYEARLVEAEREAAEMQDFLAAETGALGDSLRETEAELARVNAELERSRTECRQLVRLCEQRRQESLAALARAGSGGAARALAHLSRRLKRASAAVLKAAGLPEDAADQHVYYNDAFSRSDSGEALSQSEDRTGLAAAVARALRAAPPLAHAHILADEDRLSDDDDKSADLLDSETEPYFLNDPECTEEWWSGAEGVEGAEAEEGVAWSGDELSPERECAGEGDRDVSCGSVSERESLRTLSAAIALRQRSEAEGAGASGQGALLNRALQADALLTGLLRAISAAARRSDPDVRRLADVLKDKIDLTEKNVADVVVKKLAELDASKNMMDQYRQSVEALKNQLALSGEEDDLEFIEGELSQCSESERRQIYEALDGAVSSLAGGGAGGGGGGARRLSRLAARLERLAFAAATPPPPPAQQTVTTA